jgi:glycerophosphoryl diester phosphodiesterase
MAAFQRAIESGADGAELDVHAARDGTLVVIHDETLQRTAGVAAAVGEQAFEQLAGLDAGSWFSPEFAGERIPTLADVLELLRPTPLLINIEFKNNRATYPGLVPSVIALVERLALTGRVLYSSFNHFSLLEAKALAPESETAAVISEHLVEPWEYAARHGFGAVHPIRFATTAELVERCHAHGLLVRPWTVNEPEEAERLMRLGVDGIVTDMPRQALEWRKQAENRAGRPG